MLTGPGGRDGGPRPPSTATAITDFGIRASSGTTAAHSLDEAIERLNRHGQAGADILMADALLSQADIACVARLKDIAA